MFQMKNVGRKIATKRKEMNMTQMELADAMGVSFQAVSNWERGNSMPDIGKIPELANVLGISIDMLLTDEAPAKLVQHIVEGDVNTYMKETEVTPETIAQVAPLLKPSDTENLIEQAKKSWEKDSGSKRSVAKMSPLAPFVTGSFLHSWAESVNVVDSLKELTEIAPFLSEETLDMLVEKLQDAQVTVKGITPLAPFLSEDTLDKLANQVVGSGSLSDLTSLAPFLSDEALDTIVRNSTNMESFSIKQLHGLAPFLGEETLDWLVEHALSKTTPGEILSLAPFLSEEALGKLARSAFNASNFKELQQLAPFLEEDVLDEIVQDVCNSETLSLRDMTGLIPFLSEEALDVLAKNTIESATPDDIAMLAPHLSSDTLNEIAAILVEKNGIKGIKAIAHFL